MAVRCLPSLNILLLVLLWAGVSFLCNKLSQDFLQSAEAEYSSEVNEVTENWNRSEINEVTESGNRSEVKEMEEVTEGTEVPMWIRKCVDSVSLTILQVN